MVISWKDHVKPGTERDFIGAFWDVMPTLSDLAGIAAPDSTDGISFLPTLLQQGKQKVHQYLYWEFPSRTGQQAVRMENWKGIRDSIFMGHMKIKLYDLNNDIQEQHDVSADHPDIVNQMEQIMRKEHTPSKVFSLKNIDKM